MRRRVLPAYPADLSAKTRKSLERLGAEIRLETLVRKMDHEGVTFESKGKRERVPARCVFWAAGIRASSLARILEKEAGAALDRAGRVLVAPDCSLAGHAEVFASGHVENFSHQGNGPLPGVAPVAMQQGRYGACVIARRLEGRVCEPFRCRDRGSMATIGCSAAVADFGSIRFGGFPACLLWSAVHVFSLIECENRVLVALRWLWNYVTRHRGTWLITGSPHAA